MCDIYSECASARVSSIRKGIERLSEDEITAAIQEKECQKLQISLNRRSSQHAGESSSRDNRPRFSENMKKSLEIIQGTQLNSTSSITSDQFFQSSIIASLSSRTSEENQKKLLFLKRRQSQEFEYNFITSNRSSQASLTSHRSSYSNSKDNVHTFDSASYAIEPYSTKKISTRPSSSSSSSSSSRKDNLIAVKQKISNQNKIQSQQPSQSQQQQQSPFKNEESSKQSPKKFLRISSRKKSFLEQKKNKSKKSHSQLNNFLSSSISQTTPTNNINNATFSSVVVPADSTRASTARSSVHRRSGIAVSGGITSTAISNSVTPAGGGGATAISGSSATARDRNQKSNKIEFNIQSSDDDTCSVQELSLNFTKSDFDLQNQQPPSSLPLNNPPTNSSKLNPLFLRKITSDFKGESHEDPIDEIPLPNSLPHSKASLRPNSSQKPSSMNTTIPFHQNRRRTISNMSNNHEILRPQQNQSNTIQSKESHTIDSLYFSDTDLKHFPQSKQFRKTRSQRLDVLSNNTLGTTSLSINYPINTESGIENYSDFIYEKQRQAEIPPEVPLSFAKLEQGTSAEDQARDPYLRDNIPAWIRQRPDFFKKCLNSSMKQKLTIPDICMKPEKDRTVDDLKALMKYLSRVKQFEKMSDALVYYFCLHFKAQVFWPGEVVVKAGAESSSMFVIYEGELTEISPETNQQIRSLEQFELHHREALRSREGVKMQGDLINASQEKACILLSIDRFDYRSLVQKQEKQVTQQLRIDLRFHPFFKEFSQETLDAFCGALVGQLFFKEDIIYDVKEPANQIYFISEGSVHCETVFYMVHTNKWPKGNFFKLAENDYHEERTCARMMKSKRMFEKDTFFGEEEVIMKTDRMTKAVADSNSFLLSLSKSKFYDIFTFSDLNRFIKFRNDGPFLYNQNLDQLEKERNEKLDRNRIINALETLYQPSQSKDQVFKIEKKIQSYARQYKKRTDENNNQSTKQTPLTN